MVCYGTCVFLYGFLIKTYMWVVTDAETGGFENQKYLTFYLCLFTLWIAGGITFLILFVSCTIAFFKPVVLLSVRFLKTTLILYYIVYTFVLFLLLGTAFNKMA